MKALVGWCELDTVKATYAEGKNSVEVVYAEDDGYEYKLILETKDGITYKGDYVSTNPTKKRNTRANKKRKGVVSAKMVSNDQEIILFGRMVEDGDIYHWWVEAEKSEK